MMSLLSRVSARKIPLLLAFLGIALAIYIGPVRATVPYDREAAITWACGNNYGDNSFRGASEGRYSPTYIARTLRAGSITTIADDVIGYHQVVQWMQANPTAWQFVGGVGEMEAGDFILFSRYAGLNGSNWDSANDGIYNYGHGGVYLGSHCGGSSRDIGTWNAERLNRDYAAT